MNESLYPNNSRETKHNIEPEEKNLEILIKKLGDEEQQKSIAEVFHSHPELANIGSAEEYATYLESIFPQSVLRDIAWHGMRDNIEHRNTLIEEGFNKNKSIITQNSYDFYGFYFGDRYSHYGFEGGGSVAAMLDVRKPYLIEPKWNSTPSVLNMKRGLQETYNLTDEDGVIEIGYIHMNDNISDEESWNFVDRIDEIFQNMQYRTKREEKLFEYAKQHGLHGVPLEEIVVLDAKQIHILGSKADMLAFQNHINRVKD